MSDQEWRTVTYKKNKPKAHNDVCYPKNNRIIRRPSQVNNHIDNNIDMESDNLIGTPILDVTDLSPLPSRYIFWCHDIYNKDWSINSYIKLCLLETVSDFWRLFNNLDKLNYKTNNFFLMKEDTEPTWEHKNNRFGGICSLRADIVQSLIIFEDLAVLLMCSILNSNQDDINGLSFSPKNNWAIIKIWNKDRENDLTKTMNKKIIMKYKDFSIKYKGNEPEY